MSASGAGMLEARQLMLRPWVRLGERGQETRAQSGETRGQSGGGTPVSWRREVVHAATEQGLGHVRWNPSAAPGWLAWLARPLLQVYETEDASLLCTVRRLWGPQSRWQVRDADDRSVGGFWYPKTGTGPLIPGVLSLFWDRHEDAVPPLDRPYSPEDAPQRELPAIRVADSTGYCFAWLRGEEGDGQFVADDGEALGSLRRSGGDRVLTFDPRSDPNPFLRMLLFAAVLQV